MAKNEVAVAGSDNQAPAIFIDDEMMSGPTGFENTTAKDILIPRLTILQKMSPQIDKRAPEYIEGAEVGMFCDTGTGEVFSELVVVPCFFATQYIEWHPRESGKGLAKNHGTDASCLKNTTADDKGRQILPSGNYISEVASWYVLNLSANGRRSFIPLASTALKHSRRWMTLLKNERLKRPDGSEFPPPMYYRSWKVTPIEESNTQGSWTSWKFSPSDPILALDPTKALLANAKDFCLQAKEGLVRGDVSSTEDQPKGDEVPF